ncbi:MAG TPA: tetratricopeptide repeat protein [Ktedonobacteraceae bacterium]|nr:tetratricopeptide repeat protein [Ktedonobacteraceae bacterium]
MNKSKEHYVEDAINFYKGKRYEDALKACDCAIHIDALYGRAYHGRGLILTQQKRYKDALNDYQKSCQLAPENAKLHADMGELFYIIGEYEKSSTSYKQAILLDKKYEHAYNAKADALTSEALNLFRLRLRDRAIAALQKSLLFNPKDKRASNALSELHCQPDDTNSSSFFSDEAKYTSPTSSIHRVRDNNEWNISSEIHPFNCRCAKCFEI